MPLHPRLPSPPLLKTYLTEFDRVSSFYCHNPRDARLWTHMFRQVDERTVRPPRQEMVSILLEQNRTFGSDESALSSIRDLGREDTYAVVTGQQVGLFTGFLFTIYKAVTAIKLADRLQKKYGKRVAPVFWMAADDHDLHEINHVFTCTPENEVIQLDLNPATPYERRSAAHIQFGENIEGLIASFAETLADSEFRPLVIDCLRECCTPETSMSTGFARQMARLFEGRGLILVDPTDPALKPFMRSVFEQEVRHPLASTRRVLDAADRLSRLGFHPQIDRAPDAVNLFVYHEECRTSLTYDGGKFHLRDTDIAYDQTTLLNMIETSPESFSQNVVTRPILQDILFPTLAYIGGPAELAYFGQLGDVYGHFGLPCPVAFPRASVTLVEPRIARVLEKYDLTPDDFFGDIFQVLTQRMRDEIPDELLAGFTSAREAIEAHLSRLVPQVAEIDPTLEKMARSVQNKAAFEISKLEEKTVQAFRRAHKTMRQQIEKANSQLYPRHQPQERTLNIWAYIALYGFEFMNILFDSIDDHSFDHQILTI